MKRTLILGLFLASTTLGLIGCSETTKEVDTATKDGPNGKVEVKQTTETTKTGNEKDNR